MKVEERELTVTERQAVIATCLTLTAVMEDLQNASKALLGKTKDELSFEGIKTILITMGEAAGFMTIPELGKNGVTSEENRPMKELTASINKLFRGFATARGMEMLQEAEREDKDSWSQWKQ